MKTAYIKFCGGCNPRYDRGEAVAKIKKIFGEKISFFNHDPQISRDIGIVVQGCENECVQLKNLAQAEHLIVLRYESDLVDAVSKLNEITK